jgi:hypothetical protein
MRVTVVGMPSGVRMRVFGTVSLFAMVMIVIIIRRMVMVMPVVMIMAVPMCVLRFAMRHPLCDP